MSLSNCPSDFHLNCSNYIFKCTICTAGSGSTGLFYKPLEKSPTLKQHPIYIPRLKPSIDKLKSKQVKGGYSAERKLSKQIAKQTIRSGALLHDGDISLFDGELKLDSKLRYDKDSFSLSKSEYLKGIQQHLDGWIITNKHPHHQDSVVILTFDAFTQLLSYKQQYDQQYDQQYPEL